MCEEALSEAAHPAFLVLLFCFAVLRNAGLYDDSVHRRSIISGLHDNVLLGEENSNNNEHSEGRAFQGGATSSQKSAGDAVENWMNVGKSRVTDGASYCHDAT